MNDGWFTRRSFFLSVTLPFVIAVIAVIVLLVVFL